MVSRVFVSAHGNVFMREIADHLAEAASVLGHRTVVVTDELPDATADPFDNLVVAPHEFFELFPAPAADVERAAGHAVSINTEQPGTPFFERAIRFARRGPVVLDINAGAAAGLRRLGLRATHLPLGYVPSMDHRSRIGHVPRPVDIAMLAGRTPRRERFLGGAASQLWEWRTDLRMFSWHQPVLGDSPSFLAGAAKYDALARTRILLNVHRGDDGYFEWARVVEAAANGCVVVSETSQGTAPFVAGEHYVDAPLEYLAEEAVALALDEPRRARIAAAAHDLLTGELDQARLLERALSASRSGERTSRPWPVQQTRRHLAQAPRSAAAGARRVATRALRSVTAGQAVETEALRVTVAGLKEAYLDQVEHGRAIERALSAARGEAEDVATTTATPAWRDVEPAVSVVVTLHDEAPQLREAVGSVVAAASGPAGATEVIIVDDLGTEMSNSGGRAEAARSRAERILAELAWFPILLCRRAAAGGQRAAHRTGVEAARAPAVFMLDASDVLYPSGLRRLVERLDAASPEVVATYGILERFDDTGAVGLTSHLAWDVDLLLREPYIDGMAMFRRDRWRELSATSDPPALTGWEAHDLWLAAAERGWRAELVTEIVGRSRVRPRAVRRIRDIDGATTCVVLRERHPRLPWPS